jgi:hypothetical protein
MHSDARSAGTERRTNRRVASCNQGAHHLTEVATILALGIQRLRARQGALRGSTEETVGLDFTALGSGHATPRQREVPHP